MTKNKIILEVGKGTNLSIINLVDYLIEHAFELNVSDIHLDPNESSIRVRFRVDGYLTEVFIWNKNIHAEIIFRIKILCGLRTDQHNLAQDGRFRLFINNINLDIRVSIVPTFYGENCVLRLLNNKTESLTLESLGFNKKNLEIILKNTKRPFGMILVTGPTGSGKTTTLYTILKLLNTAEKNLITIEDPVEYSLVGIKQIPVNNHYGLTFANGLRSILRQDPDIVMVGEIRDSETAGLAINTALTGHLLLSTLHTNDPASTLPRFLDMGIEPYLVASTINLVIGQRLVRKICSDCKVIKKFSEAELESLVEIMPLDYFVGNKNFYCGQGCASCHGSGYSGRVALHEVLEITEPIRQAIFKKAPSSEIKQLAVLSGMVTILEDGMQKASLGLTTVAEVLRIIYE